MTDEEALFAYIDGELEGDERARVEAMINADPAKQAIVAEHRALAARLQSAFSTVVEAPIPPALAAAAKAGSDVVSLAEVRSRRDAKPSVWKAPHWTAMAATLFIGIVGGAIFSSGGTGPVVERGGRLVASGSLEHALSTQLASNQDAKAPVRIGLTFRNEAGAACRSFIAEAVEGVACRESDAWLVRGLLAREAQTTGDYRMATGSGSMELVDRLIEGEPLDESQERAALANEWATTEGHIDERARQPKNTGA